MLKKIDRNIFFLGLISVAIFVFYLFYINFSIDTLILFLSNKIFLGKWLARGVFPWFNPHIFLGLPFAFDSGLGNFHPFNLLFIFPFPWSFALWVSLASFLFMVGYYLFLADFTKTKSFAFILTLILFFSGSGWFRINNPTIFLVVAHFGIFLWSLKFIKKRIYVPLIIGTLLIISGHLQFVVYGFVLGIFVGWRYYKISLLRLITFFAILFFLNAWFFVFSLPLVFDSTRLTMNKDYVSVGSNHPFHLLQTILPFIFGHLSNGSKWQVGPTYTVLISYVFTFFIALSFKLKYKLEYVLMFVILLASLGLVNLPFLRNAGQIMCLLHSVGILVIAHEEKHVFSILKKLRKHVKSLLLLGSSLLICSLFFFSPLFANLFFNALILIHKSPGLFYDLATVKDMGVLMSQSLMFVTLFITTLIFTIYSKNKIRVLTIFIVIEGFIFCSAFNFFVPTSTIFSRPLNLPQNYKNYRVQSSPDVIPYHGISFYMSDVILQPPYSKEVPYVDSNEKSNFTKLRGLFNLYPSTWIMTTDMNAVQGFDTFITKDISTFFTKTSLDFKEEYAFIIKRNPLFAQIVDKPVINGLETSKVTLNDPRWEKLGVRYFISDRPLKKYTLIEEKKGRYIYENEYTLPIYRITDGEIVTTSTPYYSDPNQWKFTISRDDIGKEFQMVMNPGGFVAMLNGKEINIKKEPFLLRIPLYISGDLVVYYSPVRHLYETIASVWKSFRK